MNWIFTRPGKVHFEKGEPFCFITLTQHRAMEAVQPIQRSMAANTELREQYDVWMRERSTFNTKLDNGTLYVRSVRVMLHYVKAHQDQGIDIEMYRGLISAAFSNHEKVCLALLGLNEPEFLTLLKAGGAIANPVVRVEPFTAWPEPLLKAIQKA